MPDSWIASHVPGRLRLRHLELRRPSRNEAVQTTLRGWDGVLSVTGNPATGGILIHYDPARIPPAEMESRIGATLRPPVCETAGGATAGSRAEARTETRTETRTEAAEPPPAPGSAPNPTPMSWRINRAAKIGMLGSLSGTLLALAVGKKLHAAFGVAHLAFLAAHLTVHRKKLLR